MNDASESAKAPSQKSLITCLGQHYTVFDGLADAREDIYQDRADCCGSPRDAA